MVFLLLKRFNDKMNLDSSKILITVAVQIVPYCISVLSVVNAAPNPLVARQTAEQTETWLVSTKRSHLPTHHEDNDKSTIASFDPAADASITALSRIHRIFLHLLQLKDGRTVWYCRRHYRYRCYLQRLCRLLPLHTNDGLRV
jgi:hypothetical protein